MNEVFAILSFALLNVVIVACARLGKEYLAAVSVFIIIATNATIGIQVEVFGVSISWAVILYSLVYLITDICSEFYEKYSAYKIAAINLGVQILFWIYIYLTMRITASAGVAAFETVAKLYAITPRITVAAIVASAGAFVDIMLYEWIRGKFPLPEGESVPKHLWVRNNVSTIIGQSLNTALFFTIALYGVLPNLWSIIISAIVIKWAIAVLDTPAIYLCKRLLR